MLLEQLALHGPELSYAVGQASIYAPQVPTAADRLLQFAERAFGQGQQMGQGGNTAGPGGLDPNKFDPWRWTKSNYRNGYEKYYETTRDPANYAVHHVLPQRFESTLSQAGLNVHDPRLLREVQLVDDMTGAKIHQTLYTEVWEGWASALGHSPTAQEIVSFARRLEADYATANSLFYRQGPGMPRLAS